MYKVPHEAAANLQTVIRPFNFSEEHHSQKRSESRNIQLDINLLKPNAIYIYIYIYICRTAARTSRRYILNIYSTNIHTEYFKHAA